MATSPPSSELTQAGIDRRVLIWQIAIFGGIVAAICTMTAACAPAVTAR